MTIAYFDTSALVPLLIDEPSTTRCRAAWNGVEEVASSTLAFVEVRAALAQASRLGRIDEHAHRRAVSAFDGLWASIIRVAPGKGIIGRAAELAAAHSLRGYDAVHCATALAVASDEMCAVSGDRDLLRAWSALGLPTIDTAA